MVNLTGVRRPASIVADGCRLVRGVLPDRGIVAEIHRPGGLAADDPFADNAAHPTRRVAGLPPGCTMRAKLPCIAVTVLVAALAAGCGSGKYHPVEGKVTLRGNPLLSGVVEYHPTWDPALPHPQASIRPDGTYRLSTAGKDGALGGEYRVTVRPVPSSDGVRGPRGDIPFLYQNSGSTSLGRTVPAASPGDYDLKLQDGGK
jgi:hypothetical protein